MPFNPTTALEQTHTAPGIDRLSRNPVERAERWHTALHEAHHLMGAVLFDSWVLEAYVPRPGESPPGMKHAAGAIITNDQRTIANGVTTLLGPIAEMLIQGNANNPQAQGDYNNLTRYAPNVSQPHYEVYQHTDALIHEMKRRAMAIALGHAAEIDLAACAMLDMSAKKKGRVHEKNMQALYRWLREVVQQERGSIRDQLNDRPLFINSVPHLRSKYPGGLSPAIMKKRRQEIRGRGYLNVKLPDADLEKYGLIS